METTNGPKERRKVGAAMTTRATRVPLTSADRAALCLLWSATCAYCGRKGSTYQIDHLTPVCLGGATRLDNLCYACRRCNLWKGQLTAEKWGRGHVRARARELAEAVVDFLAFGERLTIGAEGADRAVPLSPICCRQARVPVRVEGSALR